MPSTAPSSRRRPPRTSTRSANEGASGLCEPVGPGITPGSGPGHLGLFGYDPTVFELGRGALVGRRARVRAARRRRRGPREPVHPRARRHDLGPPRGRVPDDEARAIVERLQAEVHVDGVETYFRHEREHRCLVVLRGPGLDPRLADTDPQHTGVPVLDATPLVPDAKRTAEIVAEVDAQVRTVLADQPRANGLLLRGFDTHRELPGFDERYGLRAAAVAIYPMYRGIARLLGMDVIGQPGGLDDQLAILGDVWGDYDYFFLHHKGTDSAGEDGDRPRKIAAIEALDAVVPQLRELGPDVIAVTGDHSTPSQMAAHSWHPVPTLLWSERCGRDSVTQYGERWCRQGDLGIRPMKDLMAFMLANGERLQKYGA